MCAACRRCGRRPGENLAADLSGRLGMHWCWAVAATGIEGLSIGNAILSRWPIITHGEVRLPTDRLAEEARVAVHARVEAPGGALPVFTTHLTYGPITGRTAQVRAGRHRRGGRRLAIRSLRRRRRPAAVGSQ